MSKQAIKLDPTNKKITRVIIGRVSASMEFESKFHTEKDGKTPKKLIGKFYDMELNGNDLGTKFLSDKAIKNALGEDFEEGVKLSGSTFKITGLTQVNEGDKFITFQGDESEAEKDMLIYHKLVIERDLSAQDIRNAKMEAIARVHYDNEKAKLALETV